MAIYDYQCQACSVVQELVQSVHTPLPETLPCPKCKGSSEQVILRAPAVMTAGMSNNTQDVAIGRDAEQRWSRIHEKKAKRDKIRKETGKDGLTATGVNEYKATDKKLQFVSTPEPKGD